LQFAFAALRDQLDQLVGEFPTQYRADLRDLPGRCADAVEPRDQRGVQGRRHRQCRQRARRKHRGEPIVAVGAFEHRLGQLFDE
jgi:hypothetical protein